ncbi:family 10 glycosylhydrolase [Fictibacillus gelatini]|uniref:family 10 glycosylhydrolase n=1 Tax=Fictibacillus gelatini TaxID=225985 RepID=UPI000407546E|nr:family 10 glycosylhydrolase [Fictibacillus gelatini]
MKKRSILLMVVFLVTISSLLELWAFNKTAKAAESSVNVSTTEVIEDTFISSQNPSTSYSISQYLVTGKHSNFGTTRSFLKFKLPSLPDNAVITSAKLSLYQYYNTTNQVSIDIRPVNSSWNASTLTWNNRPIVGSSISNKTVQQPGWYDFYMTDLVKSWYNGASNYGISVQFRDETQSTKIFYSNDHLKYDDLKPKLTITYSVPGDMSKEYRAFWVDMFHDGAKTPNQVDQLIKDAQNNNVNTIFLQVRRRGDAYYLNSVEPKTEDPYLQDGYDPLADLIQKAHSANPKIQVHAWFAMMPIWNKSTPPKDPNHIFNAHGMTQSSENNWLSKTYTGSYVNGSDYVIDPGQPDAVNYTRDVIMRVVRNYDVDGIHMDLVRYMGEDWGYNDISVERYNKAYKKSGLPQPSDPTWKQWRRDQVSNMVRKIYTSVQRVKPSVTVSAATIAWGDGPKTKDDWNQSSTMNSALQDWQSWLEEGAIDIAVPMNYFREYDSNQQAYYEHWLEWEKNHQGKRMTLSGVGIYLNSIQESLSQIKKAQAPSSTGKQLGGISLYSYAVTNKDGTSNTEFYSVLSSPTTYSQEPVFSTKISAPELPWKISPSKGHLSGSLNGSDHELVTITGPEVRQTYSDGSGDFQAIDLTPGGYTIEVNGKSGQVTIEAGKVSTITLE